MDIKRFFLILRARCWVVLYVLLCVIVLTLVVNLTLPSQYTASVSVVVDVKSPDPVVGMVLPAVMMPGYMATQVDIINSDRVARRVVNLLKLDETPDIRQQWQDATDGKGKLDDWLSDRLQKTLIVQPSRVSNVITIDYVSPDPKFSAVVANAFAQAYIDTNIDLAVEPARQYANWFEQQSRDLRDRLEAAQSRLSEYQQEKGIVATDERMDNETLKLNELSTQLSITQGQSAEMHSKQISGSPEMLFDVMHHPVIMNLKTDIARLEARRQELAGNLGSNHPQYQRAEAEIASLRQKLAGETKQIADSIRTSNHVSQGKEKELLLAIGQQKKKLLDLKRQRDELAVLQRDVESAQKAYDAVAQRFTQSSLESKVTQTNISVLAAATDPTKASSPRVLRNLLAAIFFGTAAGVVVALIMERLDRRVRSAGDIERIFERPILIEIKRQVHPGAGRWQRLLRIIFGPFRRSPSGIGSGS